MPILTLRWTMHKTHVILFLLMILSGSLATANDDSDFDESEFDEAEWLAADEADFDSWQEVGGETSEQRDNYDFYSHLAPYYSSFGMIIQLSDDPLAYQGIKSEYDVYRDLLLEAYLPELITLEFSYYPMPLLGAGIRKHFPDVYEDGEIIDDLNLIESVTAGFEEPYSLSILFNSLTAYKTQKHSDSSEDGVDIGFMGYLLSGGHYHIQRNKLIRDLWFEIEWKLKGQFTIDSEEYSWNFRLGAKNHDNKDIADTLFVALKRDHIDIEGEFWSILDNTGLEFTYVIDQSEFTPVETSFIVNKYIPSLSSPELKVSVDFGVIYENNRKYLGNLALPDKENNLVLVLRPGIQF